MTEDTSRSNVLYLF